MWDVTTGAEVKRFAGHVNGTTFVGFLPGGEEAISTGMDGVVRIWGIKEGKEFRSFRAYQLGTYKGAMSNDGKFLLAYGGDEELPSKLKLFDVATGKALATYPFDKSLDSLAISAKGKWGVIECGPFLRKGKQDRTVLQIWDLQKRVLVQSYTWTRRFPPFPKREWCWPQAISPDERLLVAVTKHPQNGSHHFGLLEIQTGNPITKFEGPYSKDIFFVGFTSDGKNIVTVDRSGIVNVLDSTKGKKRLESDLNDKQRDTASCIALSPDAKKVFVSIGRQQANQDMRLFIWDITTPEKTQQLWHGLLTVPASHIGVVARSPDRATFIRLSTLP
jgi:WD40 repeat protein